MNFDRSALKDKRRVEAGKKSRELVRKKEISGEKRIFTGGILGESGVATEKKQLYRATSVLSSFLSPSFLFNKTRPTAISRVHATLYPVSHLVGQSVGRYDLSTFKLLKNEGKSEV